MALVKRKDDPTKGDEHNEKIVDNAVGKQNERMNMIIMAMDDLESTDFNSDGITPSTGALQRITGLDNITAKERDDAFTLFNG